MDGKELYDHELVQKGIHRFIDEAYEMGMNKLELQKVCEAIAFSCQASIAESMEEFYGKEETPDE